MKKQIIYPIALVLSLTSSAFANTYSNGTCKVSTEKLTDDMTLLKVEDGIKYSQIMISKKEKAAAIPNACDIAEIDIVDNMTVKYECNEKLNAGLLILKSDGKQITYVKVLGENRFSNGKTQTTVDIECENLIKVN